MHCEVFQWASYQIQLRGHSCPEKENGDSSAFHYMPALPDYLGSSLPDMAQMSWSTVWVTKSPGCNWILSFSVLVRNTAHFLSKLTTKFSHKMVSWGILALVSSLQNWVKKVNIVLLSRFCITLRHTEVIIGVLGQFALIAGAVDVHVGGTYSAN